MLPLQLPSVFTTNGASFFLTSILPIIVKLLFEFETIVNALIKPLSTGPTVLSKRPSILILFNVVFVPSSFVYFTIYVPPAPGSSQQYLTYNISLEGVSSLFSVFSGSSAQESKDSSAVSIKRTFLIIQLKDLCYITPPFLGTSFFGSPRRVHGRHLRHREPSCRQEWSRTSSR